MAELPRYLTTSELARVLRYRSGSAVRNLLARGAIVPAFRRGRTYLFELSEVERMMRGYGDPVAREEFPMGKRTRHPGIEIMTDGRKRIRLRAVDPRTGRMKEVDRIVELTVEEAVRLRAELQEDLRNADRRAAEVPRLADYAESWMRSRALAVKPATARSYASLLDHHVLPALGDFYLDKITTEEIRQWQGGLAERRKPASCNDALNVLKMLLGDACAEFELPRSPAERVRALPTRKPGDEEANILSAEELGRVLAAIGEQYPVHHPFALMLALTGLRFGEASALEWTDIDEGAGLIRVRRAQWRGIMSTTKTGKIRSVPLVAELAAALREHRARMVARQVPGLENGWIFPSATGGMHTKSILRVPLRKALKKAGITRRFTLHGFRRTFNNLSRQVAGEILTRSITGHVTQAMTEHYSHVGAEEKRLAAGRIVQLVMKASSGGSGGGSN